LTFLPIQFRSKLEILDNEINVTDALDIVEDYFRENNYNYIKRKKDRVIFHKANGWSSLNFKSFLVSGIVKIRKEQNQLIITNGNWLVFSIVVPFLIIYLLGNISKLSFDEFDFQMLFFSFAWLFGVNLLARIFAHWKLKSILKKKINSFVQQEL